MRYDREESDGSDQEILADLIGATNANKLLDSEGDIHAIARMSRGQLSEIIGATPARKLTCAFEIGKRAHPSKRVDRTLVCDSEAVYLWATPRLAYLAHEELWLLALDSQNRLIVARMLAKGGAHSLSIAVKDVLAKGLRENARAFILVHNHPSGDPAPSAADIRFTAEVKAAAEIVGMPMLDHVIVAGERFRSI